MQRIITTDLSLSKLQQVITTGITLIFILRALLSHFYTESKNFIYQMHSQQDLEFFSKSFFYKSIWSSIITKKPSQYQLPVTMAQTSAREEVQLSYYLHSGLVLFLIPLLYNTYQIFLPRINLLAVTDHMAGGNQGTWSSL